MACRLAGGAPSVKATRQTSQSPGTTQTIRPNPHNTPTTTYNSLMLLTE